MIFSNRTMDERRALGLSLRVRGNCRRGPLRALSTIVLIGLLAVTFTYFKFLTV